jgi:hypothetical protein
LWIHVAAPDLRSIVGNVIRGQVLLSDVTDGQHDNLVVANGEHGAMRWPAPDPKKQVANQVGKTTALSGLGMPLRIVRQSLDSKGQTGVPSIRLSFRTVFRPPNMRGLHLSLCLFGNRNSKAHA